MNTRFEQWKSKAKLIGIYDKFKFSVINDSGTQKVVLDKYYGTEDKLILPPVDIIGNSAFYCNTYIEELEVSSVTDVIEDEAFSKCINLRKVIIHGNIDELQRGTFYNCFKLAHIELPESVEIIDEYALYGCVKLESLSLPHNLIAINSYALFNTGLVDITIPKSVKFIGEDILGGCRNLKRVTLLPTDLTTFGGLYQDGMILSSNDNLEIIKVNRKLYKDMRKHVSRELVSKIKCI